MKHNIATGKKGYTIVEVVVALCLLALVATTFMGSTMVARKTAEADLYESAATAAACGYMEQLVGSFLDIELASIQSQGSVVLKRVDKAGLLVDDPFTVNSPTSAFDEKIIDIHTDKSGNALMQMKLNVMLTVNASPDMKATQLGVYYKWNRPDNGTTIKKYLKTIRGAKQI